MIMNPAQIHVAVATIVNDNDEVFICKRHADSHQGGLWEFPGGKVEANETVQQALVRELHEETGITISESRPLIRVHHDYGDKAVLLDVWKVQHYTGTPHGKEAQPARWAAIATLDANEFPAADVAIIKALQLPERYLITGSFDTLDEFSDKLSKVLSSDIRLVQLRLKPDWLQQNLVLADQVLEQAETLCARAHAMLLLNVPESLRAKSHCNNIHADSTMLLKLSSRPDCDVFSASCHTQQDLEKAEALHADFAVLSPVQKTSTHPDAEPLGWAAFQNLVEPVNLPVFALGGVGDVDIKTAHMHGGQGVAGIGAFW